MHSSFSQAADRKQEKIKYRTGLIRMGLDPEEKPSAMDFIKLQLVLSGIKSTDKDYKYQRRLYNLQHNPDMCGKCWKSWVTSEGMKKGLMTCDEIRTCPKCRELRAMLETEILEDLRVRGNGHLYTMWVKDEDWQTVYKAIKRAEAHYTRVPQNDTESVIYLSSDLKGKAEECDIELVNMVALLSDLPLDKNITHSNRKGAGGEGEGDGEEELEEFSIKSYQIIHNEYNQVDEMQSFAEAVIEKGEQVESVEQLEKVMNGVLVRYSEKMGKILSTQIAYMKVTVADLAKWNKTLYEYSLSFKNTREYIDKHKEPEGVGTGQLVPV